MKKLVFIHIEKTAGSSVESALKLPIHDHRLLRERMNEVNDANSFVFSIVRNPFDLAVSKYFWRTHNKEAMPKGLDFTNWVIRAYRDKELQIQRDRKRMVTCSEWLKNEQGIIKLDMILRFENLKQDFKILCDKIGKSDIILPHEKKMNRDSDYRKYYNEDTRKIIEEYFKEDLERFNYSF